MSRQTFVWKLWAYAKRGYSSWITYVVGIVQFVVIVYEMSIKNVPALATIFPSLAAFTAVFVATFAPITILVGWWDYRKGSAPMENEVMGLADPWKIDVSRALILLADGKTEEVKEILRKWAQ
jgi:hypothetical protein